MLPAVPDACACCDSLLATRAFVVVLQLFFAIVVVFGAIALWLDRRAAARRWREF